jgi:AbrB family looped-hinge helix DNA binding protein
MPCGIINGMKLTLDKSGRVVLPKPLRQRLGFRAGTTFEAVEASGGLLLRPITQGPSLVERRGFLVHTGEISPAFDWQQLSDDLAQERVRDILGQ